MEQHAMKSLNNCMNTNIYSYLETSGGQSSYLYLNVVHFFNTSVNLTSVAAEDNCFPALMSNKCCSIRHLWQLLGSCFLTIMSNMCYSINLWFTFRKSLITNSQNHTIWKHRTKRGHRKQVSRWMNYTNHLIIHSKLKCLTLSVTSILA
jgi:hypothetical protein